MSYPYKIVFRSLVKPFYRENLSILFFLFILMFGVVGEADGGELFAYHYSLALGLLQNNYSWLVFTSWLLYTRKFTGFVSGLLRQPQYGFMTIYNNLDKTRRFRLFLLVEAWLMLPVLLYAVFLTVIGCIRHLYLPVAMVLTCLLLLCAVAAAWHAYLLSHLHKDRLIWFRLRLSSAYELVLLRYVAHKQRIFWVGLKLFTCGVLYMIALNNTAADYDPVFPFLFFNFGILGNGVIVHGIREFEETYLSFYRGAAVPLLKRLAEYSLVYFVLLIPEFITASLLVPVHLHYSDAILFSLCGYSLVLLMHGITYLRHFGRKEYLVLLLMIFSVQYFFLAGIGLGPMALVLSTAAVLTFWIGYYRFERTGLAAG